MTGSDRIKEFILNMINDSSAKCTPAHIQNIVKKKFGNDKKSIRSLLNRLVAKNEITYIYQFGNTYLVKSFNKAVRISNRVVLIPPDIKYNPKKVDIVLIIKPGISFGSGDHPSTRLAIRGIEYTLSSIWNIPYSVDTKVLDIGTGSGVLLLAALKLGIKKGIGVDRDSCARFEAYENIKRNGLINRAVITDRIVEEKHHLVIANLRTPTLLNMSQTLYEKLIHGGMIVLSGIKKDELSHVIFKYNQNGFKSLWNESEQNWSVVVLAKDNGT